ncbi:thioesterase family protein [Nocardioides sp. MAHUQ-72]|uniref:thioesterase family protein n=1 Tax=unclassified Nocardioides TaxID=2615069 RepID=UPI00361B4A76
MTESDESYFVRAGEHRFRPTDWAGGAWSPTEQHISPMVGLVVHEIERDAAARRGDGLRVGRITADILGVIALEEFGLEVSVVRPGRTIELVEAVVTAAGRPAVRVRAWLLAATDTRAVAGGQPDALASPDGLGSWPLTSVWPGGYIASLDVRPLAEPAQGRAAAWVTTHLELLAGEPTSELARYVALVDTANGIAVRESPKTWMFPNVDLSVHLFRQPRGLWVGLDTTVVFGEDGCGLTSTVLHDQEGPVGQAAQVLTIRPLG